MNSDIRVVSIRGGGSGGGGGMYPRVSHCTRIHFFHGVLDAVYTAILREWVNILFNQRNFLDKHTSGGRGACEMNEGRE